MSESTRSDNSILAKGGLTNFSGFLLRLGARFPFLLLAARLYGAGALGRFAYATMTAEFVAAMAVLGLKRGLSNELAREEAPETHVIADALCLSLGLGVVAAGILLAFPILLFPDTTGDHPGWFAPIILAIILSDVTLAALAFRHDIASAVRARSVVEPWVLATLAIGLAFTPLKSTGLLLAYVGSMLAAAVASVIPTVKAYGLPAGWAPSFGRMVAIARRNLPLAGADIAEWTTRRLDIFILGRLASVEVVGVYYVAQQLATLAGKIRASFDPILVPMLSVTLRDKDFRAAARHVRQVGFWVITLQLPVVLAASFPAKGLLSIFGPEFAVGGVILAVLLTAELVAANASVPELALIFTTPARNLLLSVIGLGVQAAFSFLLIPSLGGEGAAAGLLISMLFVAVAKQLLLRRILRETILFWRWPLLWAGALCFGIGFLLRPLPLLAQTLVTIPAILLVFGALMWRFGFNDDDRVLFQRRRA